MSKSKLCISNYDAKFFLLAEARNCNVNYIEELSVAAMALDWGQVSAELSGCEMKQRVALLFTDRAGRECVVVNPAHIVRDQCLDDSSLIIDFKVFKAIDQILCADPSASMDGK